MAETAWSWQLRQTIPSQLDAGHRAIEQLVEALRSCGWDGKELFHVQLAAEEAMVNAVKHGNQEAADKSVELEFQVSTTCARLRVRDEGSGFAPSELPDPRDDTHLTITNGRGVMLMKEVMCQVHYNAQGNEVTMVKSRAAGGAPAC